MIAKVTCHWTQRPRRSQTRKPYFLSLRALRSLRPVLAIAVVLCGSSAAEAHDFERTQVTLTFAGDGSFVLDIANDAAWLDHRLIPFRAAGARGIPSFADRIVLFVDGREV